MKKDSLRVHLVTHKVRPDVYRVIVIDMNMPKTVDDVVMWKHGQAIAIDDGLFLFDRNMTYQRGNGNGVVYGLVPVGIAIENVHHLDAVAARCPEPDLSHLCPGADAQQKTAQEGGYDNGGLHPYLLGFDVESMMGAISGPVLSFLPNTEIFT